MYRLHDWMQPQSGACAWVSWADAAQPPVPAWPSRRKARQLVAELQRLDACGVRLCVHWCKGRGIGFSCPDLDALVHLVTDYSVELELLGLYMVWTVPGTLLVFEQPETVRQIADLFGFDSPRFQRVYLNEEENDGYRRMG